MVGYQVQDGPNNDFNLDMQVTQAGRVLEDVKAQSGWENSYPGASGPVQFCFFNRNGQQPSKLVSFYVYVDEVQKKDIEVTPLQKELALLREGLRAVKEDQQYIVIRERNHRNTAESTNSRVLWWSLVQVVMVFGSCIFQIWYLTRFFEVKRAV